jgi:hypothetical protein
LKIKKLLSATLLLFVLFSISFFVYKELNKEGYNKGNIVKEEKDNGLQNNKGSLSYSVQSPKESKQERKNKTKDMTPSKSGDSETACNFQDTTCNCNNKVIAYYFHGTYRCITCRTIERYSKEAIERYFAQELKNGTLEFKPINVEEPENRHFIHDYQLYTRSLVLVRYRDDKQQGWRNLTEVWAYVRDKEKFFQYVKDEINNFLKEN